MVKRKSYLIIIALLAMALISSCGKGEEHATKAGSSAAKSFTKGNAYYKLGNIDSAIREYETTILYDKTHARAHYNLGVLYKEKGRYTESLHEFEEFMKYSHEIADKVARKYVKVEIKKLKAKQ